MPDHPTSDSPRTVSGLRPGGACPGTPLLRSVTASKAEPCTPSFALCACIVLHVLCIYGAMTRVDFMSFELPL